MNFNHIKLEFRPVNAQSKSKIAMLFLNRPTVANSFNGEMVKELKTAFDLIGSEQDLRAMILQGTGKNFCAGADLAWMKDFVHLDAAQNHAEAQFMLSMYESMAQLNCVTIAVVKGAAFGGAVGLAAAADIVIASEEARFCLSEVKLGIIPAVITPYVARRMSAGQFRRHALSARIFSAPEALSYGLVDVLSRASDIRSTLEAELNHLLQASPVAQQKLKELHRRLEADAFQQDSYTAEAIAEIRAETSGQTGIRSFLNKQSPPWAETLAPGWSGQDG